jgi:hypothetical protein
MRTTALLSLALLLGSTACTRYERDSAAREAGREAHEAKREIEQGADTAARKAGRAAHEIAEESREAAQKAGSAIKKAAGEAREGWREAARESKDEKK